MNRNSDIIVSDDAGRERERYKLTYGALLKVKDGGKELRIPAEGQMTAMQAISSVGGFAEAANKASVGVLRLQKDGTQKRLEFNAAAVINGVKGATDLPLAPGDTVLVAQATPVSVFGMVAKPGTFAIDTGKKINCSELICRAGGCTANADVKRVLIMRKANGKPAVITVDLDAVLNGDLGQDKVLMPGDVIVVNAQDQVFVLGEVKQPGAISLGRKVPLTLSKAIAQVGGVTRNANRRAILVLRGDKTLETNLKSILTKDRDAKDQQLQPGDVVYVPESLW